MGAAGIYYLMTQLGFNVTVDNKLDEPCVYLIICSITENASGFQRNPGTIKRIERVETATDYINDQYKVTQESANEVERGNFVYDVETESGRFQAGIGDMIVKNTDSCYVKFITDRSKFKSEDEYLEEHFRLAEECASKITKEFKDPIELEFEKVMYPFMLFQKKRYAYKEWVRDKGGSIVSNGIDYKGIPIVRRDFCKYVKESATNMLHAVLDKRDIEMAKRFAVDSTRNLLADKVDFGSLKISKGLNKTYKVDGIEREWDDTTVEINHPHVVVARKLKLVDPMNHPKPPDRVPYVFIKNKNKNALQCHKVSHPDYLGKEKLDALYYFKHQLQSPIDMIFEHIMDTPHTLYIDQVRERENKDNGMRNITSYFKT